MAPGTRALAFASRWFQPALVHRTFEPLIADWQREWYESAPSRRPWVSIRAWAAFICSVAISSPGVIATPTPRSISLRVSRRIALFCLLVGGALCVPMLGSFGGRAMDAPLWMTLLLMVGPTAMMIVFPFAMIIAVDAIRHNGDLPPHVERAAALKLGVYAMCAMLIAGSFVAPRANRAWTVWSTPAGWNVPEARFQQLSSFDLLTHPERTTAILATPQYTRAGEIRRELLQRIVASVMPVIFVWLRWSSLSPRSRRKFSPLGTTAMTATVVAAYFGTFYLAVILEIQWGLMPGTGFMLPLLIFTAWAAIQQGLARRGSTGPLAASLEA
jgi:hypothetical protein